MKHALIQESKKRREDFLKSLSLGSLVLIPAASDLHESRDATHPFVQNRDFFYLFPSDERDARLVFQKSFDGETKTILFCHENRKEHVLWDGERLGTKNAVSLYGVDESYPLSDFQDFLKRELIQTRSLSYPFWHEALKKEIESAQKTIRYSRKDNLPNFHYDSEAEFAKKRLLKSELELSLMQKAASITALGHKAAMRAMKPGVTEAYIRSVMESEMLLNGSERPSFTTIAASGKNACVLHNIKADGVTKEGELFLLDAGASYLGYAGDITRTFPVNGKFEGAHRDIYELVLSANEKVISSIKASMPYSNMQKIVREVFKEGLIALGILKGDSKEISDSSFVSLLSRYYPHGAGHYLGLDVHDAGLYSSRDEKGTETEQLFEPSLVFTVEPGLYFQVGDETVDSKYWGIGVRVEDDVFINQEGGVSVLTGEVPKKIKDIEAWMKA